VSHEEGELFARLSGDYNPLHLDALYARRLQFGGMVVHGVHHMLRAWDILAGKIPWSGQQDLVSLSAAMPSPVKYGDELSCEVTLFPDRLAAKIQTEVRGLQCMSLELGYASRDVGNTRTLACAPVDGPVPREDVVDQPFPPFLTEGRFPLHCDRGLAGRLFPNLSQDVPDDVLATVLACTRVVGMACPGLHSVFTGFRLARQAADAASDGMELTFQVGKTDKRFARTRIAVEGPGIEGELDTFFRPAPVAQPTCKEIAQAVTAGCFAGQHALVIGGSRGIGETTAKILTAGGALVCITYFKGEREARAVCDDIAENGGRCLARPLNVLDDRKGYITTLMRDFVPSHVYYFPTPKIEKMTQDIWHEEVFARYIQYYVAPLRKLVDPWVGAAGAKDVVLFYPSSIYIDEQPSGFQEYGAAKQKGEDMCHALAEMHPTLRVVAPRLPTIMTDQTASIIPTKANSALDVMLAELGKLANSG